MHNNIHAGITTLQYLAQCSRTGSLKPWMPKSKITTKPDAYSLRVIPLPSPLPRSTTPPSISASPPPPAAPSPPAPSASRASRSPATDLNQAASSSAGRARGRARRGVLVVRALGPPPRGLEGEHAREGDAADEVGSGEVEDLGFEVGGDGFGEEGGG